MEISEAIGHIKRGNAILFTGAGFSFGATNALNPPDNKVPDARGFSRHLASQLNSKNEYSLQVISQAFIKSQGEHVLTRELVNVFSVTSVKDYHVKIASLPWLRVYTTNYDNCFEFSALQSKAVWTPFTVDASITANKNICVHINGHVSNLSIHSLKSQVKLTHSSYSSDSFSFSRWSEQLRQDCNSAKAVFFIGFSMSDIDIARIFFSSPDLKERTFFIVSPSEDEISITPLEEYGNVHSIGIESFAEMIDKVTITEDNAPYSYTWLKQYSCHPLASPPSDAKAIDLIVRGIADSSAIAWSMAQDEPTYSVRRTEVNDILTQISSGSRWFLVHSDLGNGKTIFKEQLSFVLSNLNYKVFWDSDFENHKGSDLRALTKESGNIVVFLDTFSERFEVIDGILQLNIPNITVLICTRTTLYELGESRYEAHMPSGYIPVNLNKIHNADVQKFVLLFNKLGLWGEHARSLDGEKAQFIRGKCGGALSRLIISSFEDSEVGRRIQHAASTLLNSRTDLAAVIIGSFILNKIGHDPSPELLSSMLNRDVWMIMRSDAAKSAGEFIRFDHGAIRIRSSIVSDYLLGHTVKPDVLIWHVEAYVRRLSEIYRNTTLHHIFTELQRLPFVVGIMPKAVLQQRAQAKDLIIGYFQAISSLPFCQRNALFWLHYAMARLEFGEFQIASLYFEQAKQFASGSVGATRDVNNHFARLLIDSRIRSDEYADYRSAFQKAHEILIEQMNKDTNRHYPYRQALKYVDFISMRGDKLIDDDRKYFIFACEQVKAAISNIKGHLANATEVKKCFEAMNRAIEIAAS